MLHTTANKSEPEIAVRPAFEGSIYWTSSIRQETARWPYVCKLTCHPQAGPTTGNR